MATQKERRAAPRKPAPATTVAKPTTFSNEEIYRLIQETAYFKAKARGFEPGGEVQDWVEAEAEVKRRLQVERPRS
jgi:Protein of unknown function (DUF2934)